MVIVSDVPVGAKLSLAGGVTAEVVENLGDGEWLRVRLLSAPDGKGAPGDEELCHATDVIAVV
jgi:hypothetical protein